MQRVWRRAAALAAGLVAFNVAAHVVLPGLSLPAFLRFLHSASAGSLWWWYDRIGGGGLSRGSIVALGFMPYLAARAWVFLAGRFVPRVRALRDTTAGALLLRRWTRGLTIGAALAQSYGLAHRLLEAPDVVLQPGPGFVLRMVTVLTGGAMVAMLLSESAEALVTNGGDSRTTDPADPTPSVRSPNQLSSESQAPVLDTAQRAASPR